RQRRPPVSAGLGGANVLLAPPGPTPFVAGAAQVVALNCARAAFLAGPGNEPGLRANLFAAAELAVEAFSAAFGLLGQALYRPHLPLWEPGPDHERPPVVEANRATHVVGLVGLDEAFEFAVGELPCHNPEVSELAFSLIRDLADHVRAAAAKKGLKVRLEEPSLAVASRRLADLDLIQFGDPVRRLLERNGAEVRFTTGFGMRAVDREGTALLLGEVYQPLDLAPLLVGGSDLKQRAEVLLDAACE
ncbi:anaerobic ribonucleoside-triphosphate reductase, partial [Planctomycetota bacterium]